ncbi:hypothetical protein Tco_0999823, partial [Tanacetum coccineum]
FFEEVLVYQSLRKCIFEIQNCLQFLFNVVGFILEFENEYAALTVAQLEYGADTIDLSCMFKLVTNRYGRICRIQKNLLDRVSQLH